MRKYLFLLAAFFAGCNDSSTVENIGDGKVEVTIGGSYATSTKTALGDDLESAKWVEGDQIAVWAEGNSGFALSAECFEMRYYGDSYSVADFWATISPMEEGEYTYYGVYPYPSTYNNTSKTATFTLPTIQNGEYDGANDIMVAEPLTSQPELTGSALGATALPFSHMTHILRLEVPDGRNDFGMDLTGLDISFSQNVVGDITVDYSNPSAASTLSNGTSDISVVFDEPFVTGDGKYIWIFMHPTTLSGEVTFKARGADGYVSETKSTTSISGDYAAGKITPIKLTLPEAAAVVTSIQVTLSAADVDTRIGESLESVTFTAPSGLLIKGESNIMEFAVESDNVYDIEFYDLTAAELATLNSESLGVRFDTERVYKTLTYTSAGDIAQGDTWAIEVDVPYFLKTSFENITETDAAYTTESSVCPPVEIAGTGDDAGWYGAVRSTWTEGSHVTVRPYTYSIGSSFFGYSHTYYQSKVSSCVLGDWGLKTTATNVTINISYTATWAKNYQTTMYIIVGSTTSTWLDSNSNTTSTNITEYADTTHTISTTISGMTSSSRVAWQSNGSGGTNTDWYTYESVDIDDVTITLAK